MYVAVASTINEVSIAQMSLGAQMSAALDVMKASKPEGVEDQICVAQQFASHYEFDLPEVERGLNNGGVDQFQSHVVPYFMHHMRSRFSSELKGISDSKGPFESFKQHDLLDVRLPDIAAAGLLTYSVVDKTLSRVEEDLESLIEAASARVSDVPEEDSHLIQTLKSPWLHGALLGAIAMLCGATPAVAMVMGVGLLLVEEIVLSASSPRLITAKRRDSEDTAKSLCDARLKIQDERCWLYELRKVISDEIALPSPITPGLRRLEILKRDPGIRGKFDIIKGPRDLQAFAQQHGELGKYVVVRLSDSEGLEVRVSTKDLWQPLLVLKGEEVIGAGDYLYFQCESTGSFRLMIDDSSDALSGAVGFANKWQDIGDDSEEIEDAFRSVLGADARVETKVGLARFSSGITLDAVK